MTTCSTNQSRDGLTLVEVMLAIALLGILSAGITSAIVQSRRLAETNIYESTAVTIAVGYLEQMRAMDYDSLITSINDPSIPLPTKIDQGTNDPLFLNQRNEKEVTINVDEHGNPDVTMTLAVYPELQNLEPTTGLKAIQIKLSYEWVQPGSSTLISRRTVRTVRSWVETF